MMDLLHTTLGVGLYAMFSVPALIALSLWYRGEGDNLGRLFLLAWSAVLWYGSVDNGMLTAMREAYAPATEGHLQLAAATGAVVGVVAGLVLGRATGPLLLTTSIAGAGMAVMMAYWGWNDQPFMTQFMMAGAASMWTAVPVGGLALLHRWHRRTKSTP